MLLGLPLLFLLQPQPCVLQVLKLRIRDRRFFHEMASRIELGTRLEVRLGPG